VVSNAKRHAAKIEQESQLPTHDIEITLPTKPLKNVDTTITIRSDRKLLGRLHLSRGTIDWQRAGYNARPIEWEDFADALNRLAGVGSD
jgi:hypothetical protein